MPQKDEGRSGAPSTARKLPKTGEQRGAHPCPPKDPARHARSWPSGLRTRETAATGGGQRGGRGGAGTPKRAPLEQYEVSRLYM